MPAKAPTQELRPIAQIAAEIYDSWRKQYGREKYRQRFYAALGQLDGMTYLQTISDNFMSDTGSQVVASFLCNVTSWTGEDARRIKKELNAHLKAAR